LRIDGAAIVREVEARAVETIEGAVVRARRRRPGAHKDGARITVGAAERIFPGGREAGIGRLIEVVVQVDRTIACCFDDDNAAPHRILDCIEIVGPPFDCDIAILIRALLVVVFGAGKMQFDE
jgi:hypothetical protein